MSKQPKKDERKIVTEKYVAAVGDGKGSQATSR